jgi:cytosine/adenosine deaminase-related metal-dependent hydrolase
MTPLYHPESHIVYTANGNDVRHVFVGGKQVVLNREVLTFNVQETMDRVNQIRICKDPDKACYRFKVKGKKKEL